MIKISGKEYGLSPEMFNVSNLLFTNKSICFLSQEGYPAQFKCSEHSLNEIFLE